MNKGSHSHCRGVNTFLEDINKRMPFVPLHPATRRAVGLQPGGAVRGRAERHRWDFCHISVQSPDPAEWILRSGNISHTADCKGHFTSDARPLRAQVDALTDTWAVAAASNQKFEFTIS